MRAAYGVSQEQEPAAAAQEAAKQALERLGGKPIAAQVYVGADYDLGIVGRALLDCLGDVPMIGCSTDGEISTQGLSVDSVCLLLVSSDRVKARAAVVEGLSNGSEQAGRAIARALGKDDSRALFLLPDGLTGNGSAIIRGAQDVLGRDFILAGGTAGDRGRFEKTYQLCDGQVFTDAVVGMMWDAPADVEFGFGVMSGWKPMGLAKEVTKAEGNVVHRIEGEPALETYQKFLGDKADQLPAIGVEYPFALVDESGLVNEKGIHDGEEYILLRAPMAVDRDTGAISFAAEIPEGAKIKMTRAKSDDIVEAAREAAKRATARMSGPPDVAFFFSCMARKIVLGRRTNREIEAAQEVLGNDTPLIGFYTYGEIANCGDRAPMCRFHNETATFLTVREH